jgi:hypothetical protein
VADSRAGSTREPQPATRTATPSAARARAQPDLRIILPLLPCAGRPASTPASTRED